MLSLTRCQKCGVFKNILHLENETAVIYQGYPRQTVHMRNTFFIIGFIAIVYK